MQRFRAVVGGHALQLRPQLRARGDLGRRDPVDQRLDVVPGPADHPGDLTPFGQLVQDAVAVLAVAGDRERLGRVDVVDEVVRGARKLLGARLGRADVQVLVDLARVGRDDLAAEPLDEVDGERGLADAGRAGQDDDARQVAGHADGILARVPTPFDQRLDDLIAQIDGWIRPYVERPESPAARFYQMMAYHHGWVAADGTPLDPPARTGKRVRPILAILTCEAFGGTANDARGPAAALELIHNFSLVHDDIQDVSPQRHNRDTVWTLWGSAQGINVGDGAVCAGAGRAGRRGGRAPEDRRGAAAAEPDLRATG